MDEFKLFEMIASAKVNFNNFAKMNPAVATHPMFLIATEQLAEATDMVEEACDAE